MFEPRNDVKVIRATAGPDMSNKLRVGAYCRVSTDSEEQADSFIAQVKYYTDFISHSSDMVLVDIYADEGITGTCASKREDFQRMLKDSKAGKLDRIFVKSVSRFARNALECIENIRLLKSYGTSVLFENDNIDTDKMNSEMILYIKSAFAQSEALAGSKRVSTAIRMKMESGEFITCNAPFGYRLENGMLYPVPDEAEIVKKIYEWYLAGYGFCKIAGMLNDIDAGGKVWCAESVRFIITNEKYIGDCLLRKSFTPLQLPLKSVLNKGEVDQYYVSNSHAAIIDRDVFKKAQDLYQIKRKKYGNHNSKKTRDLSKKLICGDCGQYMKTKEQKRGIAWICPQIGMPEANCKTHIVLEEDVKDAFNIMYNKLRANEHELIDYAISKLSELQALTSSATKEINEIDAEIVELSEKNNMYMEFYTKSIMDEVSYAEKSNEVRKRLTELRSRRLRMLADNDDDGTLSGFRTFKQKLEGLPKAVIEFDLYLFKDLVKEVIVTRDEELIFVLCCGLKFKERIKK
jgi:DNA invertase Pin-like site-specific DNA recombinase